MWVKRKTGVIIMVIIMVAGQLLGEIRAAGKLLIPTAKGEKQYDAVITITRAEIMIECAKKIFQPFNEFDVPKQAKIKVSTAEVEEIQIQKNKIFIASKESFWKRYRNISHHYYKSKYAGFLSWENIQIWVLIFVVDNPADIADIGLIEGFIIDDRSHKADSW
jgi:hypothetical protein